MNELKVFSFNNVDVVDSRDVARMVEKNHKDLLRDVRGYVEVMEKSNERKIAPVDGERKIAPSDFFIPSTYKDGKGETRPCYLLTKKGCDMVANKMTGEKGVLFTASYVTAFEKMREKLSQETNAHLATLAQSQVTLMQALTEQAKTQAELAEAVKALAGKVEALENSRPAIVCPKDPPVVSLTGLAKVIINTRRILLDKGSSAEDIWKVTRSILNSCGFSVPYPGFIRLEDFFK